MAGTFAHITMVGSLLGGAIDDFPRNLKSPLLRYRNRVELGAVSPDLPLVQLWDAKDKAWGNLMHYWMPGDFIRRAIGKIIHEDFRSSGTRKKLAWVFGYTSHVVTDLTIHPVVEKKVGCYEKHWKEHFICELHQDMYIYKKHMEQSIAAAEHIVRGGIRDCGVGKKKKTLEKPIRELWESILKEINSERVSEDTRFPGLRSAPDINDWFDWFVYAVDNILEESSRAAILSGATRLFMGIPPECPNEPEARFIEHLNDPFGNSITYDGVFEFAQRNVMKYWERLCKAIIDKEPKSFDLPNGDLDTGRLLTLNGNINGTNSASYVLW